MSRNTIKKGLRDLRELFRRTHWIQGYFHNMDSEGKEQYCLVGGLRYVCGADPHSPEQAFETEDYREMLGLFFTELEPGYDIAEYDGPELEDVIVSFNDDDATTLEDILALIDKAEAKAPAAV